MVLKPILGTNSKSHLSLLSAQPNKPRRKQDRLKDRRHPTVDHKVILVIHRKNLRSLSMESSSSSSSSTYSLSYWDYVTLFLLRPVLAIAFVLSLISLGWWLAWKLVLVHVPLVQEIFGLRKKQVKPKRPTRNLTKIYSSMKARNSAS